MVLRLHERQATLVGYQVVPTSPVLDVPIEVVSRLLWRFEYHTVTSLVTIIFPLMIVVTTPLPLTISRS